ncbi:hypothetical protein, partial [Halarchaeum acidiphilum]
RRRTRRRQRPSRGGRRYPGHPTQPMDWDALAAKAEAFRPAERVETLRAACRRADEAARVGDVLDALD